MAKVFRCGSIPGTNRAGWRGRVGSPHAAGGKFSGGQILSTASARIAIATICLSVVASTLSDKARAAGAAYFVDTAEVSEPGACKVESWVSAASNHDFFAATSPTCVVNMFRPVELSTQIPVRASTTNGQALAVPKIKTNLVPTSIGSWGVAVSGGRLRFYKQGNSRRVRNRSRDTAAVQYGAHQSECRLAVGPCSRATLCDLWRRRSTGARPTMSGR